MAPAAPRLALLALAWAAPPAAAANLRDVSVRFEGITALFRNDTARKTATRDLPWRVTRGVFDAPGLTCHVVYYQSLAAYQACAPAALLNASRAASLTPRFDPLDGWTLHYPRGVSDYLTHVRMVSVFDEDALESGTLRTFATATPQSLPVVADLEGAALRTASSRPIGIGFAGGDSSRERAVAAQRLVVMQTGTPVSNGIYGSLADAGLGIINAKAGIAMVPLELFESAFKDLQGAIAGVTSSLGQSNNVVVPLIQAKLGAKGAVLGAILQAPVDAIKGLQGITSAVWCAKLGVVFSFLPRAFSSGGSGACSGFAGGASAGPPAGAAVG